MQKATFKVFTTSETIARHRYLELFFGRQVLIQVSTFVDYIERTCTVNVVVVYAGSTLQKRYSLVHRVEGSWLSLSRYSGNLYALVNNYFIFLSLFSFGR